MLSYLSIALLKMDADKLRRRHWAGERGLGKDFARLANSAKLNASGTHGAWLSVAGALYAECCLIHAFKDAKTAGKCKRLAKDCLKKGQAGQDKEIGEALVALYEGIEKALAKDWPSAQAQLAKLEKMALEKGGQARSNFPETMPGKCFLRLRAIIALKAWGEGVAIERLTQDYAAYGKRRMEGYIRPWPEIGAPLPESFPEEMMAALLKARGG